MDFSAALEMVTGNPDPPPAPRAKGANSGFGARRTCCCYSLVSCFSGCLRLIAASQQHLSWGLVLQVKVLVEPLTGLFCRQLRRGNRVFYSF